MVDYSTDFDAPAGESGPWISWLAAPSRDGAYAPGTWIYRDFDTKQAIDLSQGFVADWPASRTGWTSGGGAPGVAPVRRWNASRAKFEPRPGGPEWKKAFCIPIAYAPDARANWDQGGAGVFNAFIAFMRTLMENGAPEQLPLLPLVRAIGSKVEKFASGPSVVPIFELVRYVPRPTCLPIEEAPPPRAVTAQPSPAAAMPTPSPLPPPQAAPTQTVDWNRSARPSVQPAAQAPRPGGWNAAEAPAQQPQVTATDWGEQEVRVVEAMGQTGGLIDDAPAF